jgi:RimJ/RimL family protein N-acetyltransferase
MGLRVFLREHVPSDVEAMRRIWCDPGLMRHMATPTMTLTDVENTLAEAAREARRDERRTYRLAVVRRADDVLAGSIALDLERYSSAYGHSITLDPAIARLGYGADTIHVLLGLAFEDLHLHRVWCMCAEDNAPARGLMLKAGFQPQGKIRDFCFKNDRWQAVDTFSILEDEWRAVERGRSASR